MKTRRRNTSLVSGGGPLFQRMFTRLGCEGRPPRFRVEFYPYSSLVLTIRRREEVVYVRFSDLLRRAPAAVLDGAAALLLARVYRRKAPRALTEPYLDYARSDRTRSRMNRMRRGRVRLAATGPHGEHFDLEGLFEQLNAKYFAGQLQRPHIGWSTRSWRRQFGCYDPGPNQILLNPRAIHPAIQQNLIRPRIITAKLPPPAPCAPSDVRALQLPLKIFPIQLIEKPVQIEMVSTGACRGQANAPAAHAVHAATRAIGARVLQIRLGERPGGFAPIHARKQQRGRAFQDGWRRSSQEVGEANVNHFLPTANRQNQTGIGIKLHAEARRPAIASQPRKHPLEQRAPSRNKTTSISLRSHTLTGKPSVLPPDRRRRDLLLCFLRIIHRVARALDRVIKSVLIKFPFGAVGGQFFQHGEKCLRARRHHVDSLPDIVLFFDP